MPSNTSPSDQQDPNVNSSKSSDSISGDTDDHNGMQHFSVSEDSELEEDSAFSKWYGGNDDHSLLRRIMIPLRKFYYEYVVTNMGVTLTLISQLFNSLMILFCKLLLMDKDFDEPMHPFQILFIRMGITYVGCALYLMVYKRDKDFPLGPRGYRKYMLGRGVGGCIGVACKYFALIYLTISDTIAITFLGPTITSLMAFIFLRERFTRAEALGGMVAFLGVIIISRPSFLFGTQSNETDSATATEIEDRDDGQGGSGRALESSDPTLRLLGSMLAFAATFGSGAAMCCIRKIGFHAHALLSVSFHALITCVVSFLGIILTPGLSFQMPRTFKQWFLLILLGVAGFFMQFLLTAGVQREKAARAIAMSYSQLVYGSLFDLLIFGHWPSKMSLLGEVIIVGAVISILYFKEKDPNGSTRRDIEQIPSEDPNSVDRDSLSLSAFSIDDDDDAEELARSTPSTQH
ncbi:DEKNAAC104746 [Brettanomyces naardenensis]|uniref:DEKNAAC104746 n=1 Tax=Brettanomyces naardenensis TaxID=13370 RepID=A0A448YRJ5_BRENA|nr:DEKNAAC104746 [Brettanomyces naardenensis]